MKIRIAAAVIASLATVALSATAEAQTSSTHFGPHLAYNFDSSKFGIGAQLGVPIAHRLEFYPSFDYFFISGGSLWELNADLKYRFGGQDVRWLYTGGGLGFTGVKATGASSNTSAHANLLIGVESLHGMVHPFGEFRLLLGNGSTAQIAAGLNFTIGH